MTEASDPVTVALTGQLPFYLLLAGVLTWPIAVGLLRPGPAIVLDRERRRTVV